MGILVPDHPIYDNLCGICGENLEAEAHGMICFENSTKTTSVPTTRHEQDPTRLECSVLVRYLQVHQPMAWEKDTS